jgi:hypothetical protein
VPDCSPISLLARIQDDTLFSTTDTETTLSHLSTLKSQRM